MKYHPFYQGKIEIVSKVPVNSYDDFAIWYTPGVADPCKEIQRNPERVFDYTNKSNGVAKATEGPRELELGEWKSGGEGKGGGVGGGGEGRKRIKRDGE